MDCDVSDIETKYFEGEPEIGTVGVHAETVLLVGHIRVPLCKQFGRLFRQWIICWNEK